MTANADVAQPGDRQQADDEYTILFIEVLRRHNQGHSETDVRSAVRDFILGAELARPAEINQEESPTDGAAGRVDMVVRETFIEHGKICAVTSAMPASSPTRTWPPGAGCTTRAGN